MLTKEQNQRFTQVGAGTPMGELMRRYWLPFATVKQLTEHPTRAVTLLGEHLVAFKDRSGTYGLIQEFCPHRNTNLLWGIPEPEGLRCPYHGWMFDSEGNCLEQPAESPESTFKDRIKIQSYPVEELGGLLYAWMGPEPRPMVPRWEALVKPRILEGDDENHANWRIGHCVVFPNMLQFGQIRVPVDDTHTLYLWYST